MADDVIFQPHKSIADSPLLENQRSVAIDNTTEAGTAKVRFQTELTNSLSGNETFTEVTGLDRIVMDSSVDWNTTGVAVQFTTTGTLPAGLSLLTTYWLRALSDTIFTVHTTYADAIANTNLVDITSGGSGTHTTTVIEVGETVKIKQGFMIDTTGNFWQFTSPLWRLMSSGSGAGVGFELWQDFGFLFRGGDIDTIDLSDDAVTVDWQTDPGGPSLVGQDDKIYIASGSVVRSIARGSGSFNPSVGGTYAYSSSAIDFPDEQTTTTIAELGRYLAVGTRDGNIYFWDRSSDSFELPQHVPGIVEMLISVNNLLYVVITTGDIYVSSISNTQLVKKFPLHSIDGRNSPSFTFNPDAFRVEGTDIFIGYGTTTGAVDPIGVYRLGLATGDFDLAYVISTGATGGSSATRVKIDALESDTTRSFYIAWTQGGSTNGVDKVSISSKYTGFTAYAQSQMFRVGSTTLPRTLRKFDIVLGKPLTSAQGVRLSYRVNLNDSWIEIGTFDTINKSSKTLFRTIPRLVDIQFKAEITTDNDDSSPQVLEIRAT